MEIQCNTCVYTKPRDIQITCIISSDIGGHRVSSYCKQQKALQWPTKFNEAIVILCVHIYEHLTMLTKYIQRPRRRLLWGIYMRKNTYARNWRLEGHLLEWAYFQEPTICSSLFQQGIP